MNTRLLTGAALACALFASPAALHAQASAAVHVENVQMPADDLEATSRFYQQAFGMKEVLRIGSPTREVVLGFGATVEAAKRSPATRVQIIKYAAPPAAYDHSRMLLEVGDTASTVAKLTSLGATVVRPAREVPIDGSPKVIALMKDPAGNIFELISGK